MVLIRRAELVATSRADELSLRALADVVDIAADENATLLDGTVIEFTARVPTVETALVIKAHAYRSRREDRDVEDVYRLLEIADTYTSDEIGGWRLNEIQLSGSRRDAAAYLHEVAKSSRRLDGVDVPTSRLAALIAGLVTLTR